MNADTNEISSYPPSSSFKVHDGLITVEQISHISISTINHFTVQGMVLCTACYFQGVTLAAIPSCLISKLRFRPTLNQMRVTPILSSLNPPQLALVACTTKLSLASTVVEFHNLHTRPSHTPQHRGTLPD